MTELRYAECEPKALNESLEKRVEERSHQIRELSSALAPAEDQERQRITGVLHDDLQQLLFAATVAVFTGEVDGLEPPPHVQTVAIMVSGPM